VILCGIDQSAEAQRVASTAAELAVRGAWRLRLVHVAPPPAVTARPFGTVHERQQEADDFERSGQMRVVLDRIDLPDGIAAERTVELGDPAPTLTALAAEHSADLIVAGSGSRGLDKVVMGDTTAAIVREAPCPVLIVSPATGPCVGDVLLCGVDASESAAGVARAAERLARRLGLRLVLVHVSEEVAQPDDADMGLRMAREAVPDASLEVVPAVGTTAETLTSAGRARDAALILVGTRGRGALKAAVLGSVSSALTDTAGRPVVVVPPSAGRPT
jgi:nucleotide-binding universal stress UspA family protein